MSATFWALHRLESLLAAPQARCMTFFPGRQQWQCPAMSPGQLAQTCEEYQAVALALDVDSFHEELFTAVNADTNMC